MATPPLVHEYDVRCGPAEAFEAYAAGIGTWWHPRYTADPETLEGVTIEPRVGGRVYATHRGEGELTWGEVTVWEPGRRLAYTSTLAQSREHPSRIAVAFEPAGDGCRVRFEHSGWSEHNAADRGKFTEWPIVLERFAAMANLGWFNRLREPTALETLRGCCASRRWAERVAAGRPYAAPQDLYEAAEAVLVDLAEADVDEALAAHPRIGERPTGADSRREQAGVAAAPDAARAALIEVNREYEERFGHVYLVCATGKDADELLGIARDRLANDPETERRVLRAELAKINHLRLSRLLQNHRS